MARPRNPFLNPGDFGVLGRNPEYDAFEEGVDATLELLRPWLVNVDRQYEDDMGKAQCTGCNVCLNLYPHKDWCPWSMIDALLEVER